MDKSTISMVIFDSYVKLPEGSRTHMLHVWCICLHLLHKSPSHVGKYTIHGAYGESDSSIFVYCMSHVDYDVHIYIYISYLYRAVGSMLL